MFFLQVAQTVAEGLRSTGMMTGTGIMLTLTFVLIGFLIYYQRNLYKVNQKVKRLKADKEASMIRASIKFQEDERNRIAADLHDDAGPLLATIRLYLNEGLIHKDKAAQLQSILSARQIVDDTIGLIRNISHSLMPPTLKNFGLESAATNLYEKINQSGKIAATARFNDYDKRMEPEREMLSFRVIQELVNNIIKHSYAGFIHLVQNRVADTIYIIIQHDGKGVVQAEFEKLLFESEGLGLKNIENRMRVLGGRVKFEKGKDDEVYKITMEIPASKAVIRKVDID
jgi:two-component system, NarL family, sensor kinase